MKLAELKQGDRFFETRLSDPSIEYTVVEGPRRTLDGGTSLYAAESRLIGGIAPRVHFFDHDKSHGYGPCIYLVERGECDA